MREARNVKEMRRAYLESDVGELDARPTAGGLRRPVLVDVEAIRRPSRDEVLEQYVAHVTRAHVALDHERLIPAIGVDVTESQKSRPRSHRSGHVQSTKHEVHTDRYTTSWMAVPSDRLPIALPPDWLHQTTK